MRVSLPHGSKQEAKSAKHAEHEEPRVLLHEGLDSWAAHDIAYDSCCSDHTEQHAVDLSYESGPDLLSRLKSVSLGAGVKRKDCWLTSLEL